jgi:hypothetical protein
MFEGMLAVLEYMVGMLVVLLYRGEAAIGDMGCSEEIQSAHW